MSYRRSAIVIYVWKSNNTYQSENLGNRTMKLHSDGKEENCELFERNIHDYDVKTLQTSCRGKLYWASVGLELYVIMLLGPVSSHLPLTHKKVRSKNIPNKETREPTHSVCPAFSLLSFVALIKKSPQGGTFMT